MNADKKSKKEKLLVDNVAENTRGQDAHTPGPSFEDLSLYYDGLLQGEAQARVEAYWRTHGDDPAYAFFRQIDQALEPDLSSDQIDHLLASNTQEIHQRIAQAAREPKAGQLFWLQPKFLAGALGAIILLGLGITYFENPAPTDSRAHPPAIVHHDDETPSNAAQPAAPQDAPGDGGSASASGGQSTTGELDQAQHQLLLAMTAYAKNTINQGADFASAQSKTFSQQYEALNGSPIQPPVLRAVSAALHSADQNSANAGEESRDSANTLAQLGRQQVALGLGATMVTLVNVF